MTSTSILGNSQSAANSRIVMKRRDTRQAAGTLSGMQIAQLEAGLVRLVGSRGTQALLERARSLSGERAPSSAVQEHTLMPLLERLLGDSLAASLRASCLR